MTQDEKIKQVRKFVAKLDEIIKNADVDDDCELAMPKFDNFEKNLIVFLTDVGLADAAATVKNYANHIPATYGIPKIATMKEDADFYRVKLNAILDDLLDPVYTPVRTTPQHADLKPAVNAPENQTKVKSFVEWVQNKWIFAVPIALGVIVIALGTLTEGLSRLRGFWTSVVSSESTKADLRLRLASEVGNRIRQALDSSERDERTLKAGGNPYLSKDIYGNVVRYLNNSFPGEDPQNLADFSLYPEYRERKFESLVIDLMAIEHRQQQAQLKQTLVSFHDLIKRSNGPADQGSEEERRNKAIETVHEATSLIKNKLAGGYFQSSLQD
jgi:hypothetical protein